MVISLAVVLLLLVETAQAAYEYKVGDLFYFHCNYCGRSQYLTITAVSQQPCQYGSVSVTCTCGQKYACTVAPVHSWLETRTGPTCTAPGSTVKTCSRCTETETEELPALGHAWEEFSHTAPTCTDPGSTEYICTRCQFAKSEPIPALGGSHTWVESSRTDPTQISPGFVEYTCSVCGSTRTESLPVIADPDGDMTMTALLAKMTGVFSSALSWVSAVSQAVAGEPVLLLCAVIGFIGTGLALFKRLLDIRN